MEAAGIPVLGKLRKGASWRERGGVGMQTFGVRSAFAKEIALLALCSVFCCVVRKKKVKRGEREREKVCVCVCWKGSIGSDPRQMF